MALGSHGSERQVAVFALLSRAFVSASAVCTALVVTPYDTSTHFVTSQRFLRPFANWDGVFFAHIAAKGYDYEHMHAFFPLYPLLVRLFSKALGFLDPQTAIVVAGWLLSNAFFVLACLFLYRLGKLVLLEERIARHAALLFAITPSSIFMSALYSESLMCLCSFSGMFFLERYHQRALPKVPIQSMDLLKAALCFGAASATRSNGLLLSLFIAWSRLRTSPSIASTLDFLKYWIFTALLGAIAIVPQIAYFASASMVYCPTTLSHLVDLPPSITNITQDRPWCADLFPNFSAMYGFIQKEYWNVGFLRYYEVKQIPNFLLASPMILLSAHALVDYFRHYSLWAARPLTRLPHQMAPFCVHFAVLWGIGLAMVHIQVITRFLCACPPLFWLPAALFERYKGGLYKRLVLGYFMLFTTLGSVLFSSFYPWT